MANTQANKPRAKLAPRDVKSIGDVLALDCSYKESGNFSMLIQHDGAVILTEQPIGRYATQKIVIPRRHFLRLLEFYETEQ